MQLEDVIKALLNLPEAEETTPFGPDVLVYKVSGKMFAATNPNDYPSRVNLKCDPDLAQQLRDEHESIVPGWHMNKKHWNTVILDDTLPSALILELLTQSYRLVALGLRKAERERILNLLDRV